MPHMNGRASFWGDVYTVRRWTRNLRTQILKCVPTKWRKNGAFQKHLYHHQTIQRNTEMLFANDAHFLFTIIVSLPWSFASCEGWDVLRLNPAFFAWAVPIASMTLRTARFVCVLYAELCVNAPPDHFSIYRKSRPIYSEARHGTARFEALHFLNLPDNSNACYQSSSLAVKDWISS